MGPNFPDPARDQKARPDLGTLVDPKLTILPWSPHRTFYKLQENGGPNRTLRAY